MTIYEQELDFKSRQNIKAQFSQDVGNLSSPLTILSVNPATWEMQFLLPSRKGAGLLEEEGSLGIRASRCEGQQHRPWRRGLVGGMFKVPEF